MLAPFTNDSAITFITIFIFIWCAFCDSHKLSFLKGLTKLIFFALLLFPLLNMLLVVVSCRCRLQNDWDVYAQPTGIIKFKHSKTSTSLAGRAPDIILSITSRLLLRVCCVITCVDAKENFDFRHHVCFSFTLDLSIYWLNDNGPSFVFWKGLGSSLTSDKLLMRKNFDFYHHAYFSIVFYFSIYWFNDNGPSFVFWKELYVSRV